MNVRWYSPCAKRWLEEENISCKSDDDDSYIREWLEEQIEQVMDRWEKVREESDSIWNVDRLVQRMNSDENQAESFVNVEMYE